MYGRQVSHGQLATSIHERPSTLAWPSLNIPKGEEVEGGRASDGQSMTRMTTGVGEGAESA